MSGGYFDYRQHDMLEIADKIARVIKTRGVTEWFEEGYSEKILKRFEEIHAMLRIAHVGVHRIDWLLSGDDGEDCFLRRFEEDYNELEDVNYGLGN